MLGSMNTQFSLSRLAPVVGIGAAAISLLTSMPALGQQDSANFSAHKRSVQIMRLEQKASVSRVIETIEPAPVKRTALLSPALDERLANTLLWISYPGLPISLIVAIWHHDRRAREQMAKLLQQIATLERIWQHPQAR
jgi:hypothetical protein